MVTGAAAVLLGLASCGSPRGTGAVRRAPSSPQVRAVAQANASHEYPSSAPPGQHPPGVRLPQQAVELFARAYINWSARDVTTTLLRLARQSVGQARSEMTLAAAETRVDPTLRQGEIANHGAVEAVARLSGNARRYVVVTRETTTSAAPNAYQGLAPAWHVTVATVSEIGPPGDRRWVISGWQPES